MKEVLKILHFSCMVVKFNFEKVHKLGFYYFKLYVVVRKRHRLKIGLRDHGSLHWATDPCIAPLLIEMTAHLRLIMFE